MDGGCWSTKHFLLPHTSFFYYYLWAVIRNKTLFKAQEAVSEMLFVVCILWGCFTWASPCVDMHDIELCFTSLVGKYPHWKWLHLIPPTSFWSLILTNVLCLKREAAQGSETARCFLTENRHRPPDKWNSSISVCIQHKVPRLHFKAFCKLCFPFLV